LRLVAEGGRDAFYTGPIADRLVAYSQRVGGLLAHDDLRNYRAEWQDPIGIDYRGQRILQCPPNGQGFAALLALRAVEFAATLTIFMGSIFPSQRSSLSRAAMRKHRAP
jgi:gamma-glutamyltranspeptidase/glutathione hydrolase